jgi:hypothetical protein
MSQYTNYAPVSGSHTATATSGDAKLTPPGIIRAEPNPNGSWLIRIGRTRGEKRFNLTRNEAAELVRILTRDVVTAAEVAVCETSR